MKDPAKYLKEGMTYPFVVIRESVLPDGTNVWLLQDIEDQKILLEKMNYTNYSFTPGSYIYCRVDKINCSGKIFLEPPHPVYKDNQLYDFDILKMNSSGSRGAIAVVKDMFGNEINVDLSEKTAGGTVGNKLHLKVKLVKKGVPLVIDPEKDEATVFEEKKQYIMYVEGQMELMNGVKFILLRDRDGNQHFLPADWYINYQLVSGQEVYCEVVKVLGGGKPVLEPVHPEYKRGEHYQLAFVREEEMTGSKGEFRNVVVVSDARGQRFYILKKHFESKKIPRIITCRVEKYRKGKVFFEPVNLT